MIMPSSRTYRSLVAAPLAAALVACSQDPRESPAAREDARASAQTPAASAKVNEEAPPVESLRPAPVREGGALARGARDEALYIADEDHGVVRVIPLRAGGDPSSGAAPRVRVDEKRAIEVKVPGAPAQVLALDGRVLVTIRDPGLLLLMRPDPARGLVEEARVPLPPDAWGVAVTPDEATAIVSSPWSNKVSAVRLDDASVRSSIDVPREPRAIVVPEDGSFAYVTHLSGRALTRVDGLSGEPTARSIDLPPAPASAPFEGHPDAFPLDASLAYSAVLSPDGARLFVPRHALGAYGRSAWFGRPTVDVLLTTDESPLLPPRVHAGLISDAHPYSYPDQTISADGQVPLTVTHAFTQPRAIAYRRASKTLLVAGEGDDRLAELDARALDPALKPLRVYELGAPTDPKKPGDTRCGAPTGLALSADESQAFVFCRSTGDLAVVALDTHDKAPALNAPDPKANPPVLVHLADDALDEQAAVGRRLFYNASDSVMSQGLACAGCHPEGREDGHVWVEHHNNWGSGGWLSGGATQDHGVVTVKPGRRSGFARQTPALVSRVAAAGPYGWHGDGKSLEQRILFGFGMHRWEGDPQWLDLLNAIPRAASLAAFLREGLVAPPMEARELTEEEARGKAVFMASETMCAACHAPTTGYTDRSVVKLRPIAPAAGFEDEPVRPAFKTPSLLFVGRTAPYFHDGRYATLEALIEQNHDRMGLTDQLPREDRAALVAFLKTLGVVSGDADAPPRGERPRGSLARAGALARGEAAATAIEDTSSFTLDPPSAEASARPSRAEWEGAAAVELLRQSPMCKVHRVREWMRVRCSIKHTSQELAQVTLISGSKEGVELGAAKGVAEMIVPVRRGDRRLLEVDRLVEAWKSWVLYDGTVVVSEAWLPGAGAPEIAITSEPLPPAREPSSR